MFPEKDSLLIDIITEKILDKIKENPSDIIITLGEYKIKSLNKNYPRKLRRLFDNSFYEVFDFSYKDILPEVNKKLKNYGYSCSLISEKIYKTPLENYVYFIAKLKI